MNQTADYTMLMQSIQQQLTGQTIIEIAFTKNITPGREDRVVFKTLNGKKYALTSHIACHESFWLSRVIGIPTEIIGERVTNIEVTSRLLRPCDQTHSNLTKANIVFMAEIGQFELGFLHSYDNCCPFSVVFEEITDED